MDDPEVLSVKEQWVWRLVKAGMGIQVPEPRKRERLGTGDDGMARKGGAGEY